KLVDQMLGKGKTAKTPAPALPSSPATPTPTPIDPLADVWPPLQANPGITSEVHWEVKYGSHKLANAQAVNGWFFFVMPGPASTPQPTLAAWFTQIGQALKGSKLEAVIPQAAVEMQQAEHSLMGTFKPRLPQTPEEEKELLEIAIKAGPKGLS